MNLYSYSRKRLFTGRLDRQDYISVLTKRLLKSVARSTGARIHTNKWVNLVDRLACTYALDQGPQLLADMGTEFERYAKSHPKTVVRLKFLISYIAQYRCGGLPVGGALFQTHEGAFESEDDLDWLKEIALKHRMMKGDCGHWHGNHEQWRVQGNQDTYDHIETMCPTCAETMLLTGRYVRAGNRDQCLILNEFAVIVRSYAQNTFTGDRRMPGVSFDMRRQIWHDEQWTPYSGLIDGYHSSRAKGFKLIESPWYRSHRRAFGCELEVQVRAGRPDAAAGRVHDVLNPSGNVGEYCFFERDGSIGEGFELITQPAGLDIHRDKFAMFLKDEELKRGLRSHEGGACGLHVHVGREFVTQSQIYRIQSFLNDVRNEALIRTVARRYDAGYAKFKPQMAKFTAKNKHNGDRYEALNVTGDKTIEFRIFRGSLRYESVISAIEFVNAVMTFCTPGVTSLLDFNAVGFKRFLLTPEMKDDTKYLRSYLSLDESTDGERVAA